MITLKELAERKCVELPDCTCLGAYKDRDLVDPKCFRCEIEDVEIDLTKYLKAEGYVKEDKSLHNKFDRMISEYQKLINRSGYIKISELANRIDWEKVFNIVDKEPYLTHKQCRIITKAIKLYILKCMKEKI